MDREMLATLKERAQKATQGEWLRCFIKKQKRAWIIDEAHNDILCEHPDYLKNVAYIVAANPTTILALIAELERLRKLEA